MLYLFVCPFCVSLIILCGRWWWRGSPRLLRSGLLGRLRGNGRGERLLRLTGLSCGYVRGTRRFFNRNYRWKRLWPHWKWERKKKGVNVKHLILKALGINCHMNYTSKVVVYCLNNLMYAINGYTEGKKLLFWYDWFFNHFIIMSKNLWCQLQEILLAQSTKKTTTTKKKPH